MCEQTFSEVATFMDKELIKQLKDRFGNKDLGKIIDEVSKFALNSNYIPFDCVLQDWVLKLNYKKQTVLMECIRAPDTTISLQMKQIVTFFRSVILKNADPTTDFMKDANLPAFESIEREFERFPLHGAHHILMTMEVIAYDYPNPDVRMKCLEFYTDAVHSQHLNIETKEEYEKRMKPRAYNTYKP